MQIFPFRMHHALLSLPLLCLLGCGSQQPTGTREIKERFAFDDITCASGLEFTYQNGSECGRFSIAETVGGGVGVLDYDLDGNPDFIFAAGGTFTDQAEPMGLQPELFRNLDGRFHHFGKKAGLVGCQAYNHSVTIADYDADGFPDVLITGYGGLTLYRNQGDGTFQEVTQQTGLTERMWSTAAGWGDITGNGLLDLYVVHYLDWSSQNDPTCYLRGDIRDVCGPSKFRALNDSLYIAQGDGTFVDGSESSGLIPEGRGLGVVLADFNGNGSLDIYVANDTDNNFLYFNDGSGKLRESGVVAGAAFDHSGKADGSMGVSIFDFSGNDLPDIWVTNYENDSFALYRNEAHERFTHISAAAGIYALGSSYVGWGTVTEDLNHDGKDEILVTNGHVFYRPTNGEKPQYPFLLQRESERFQRYDFVDQDSYFSSKHDGRGVVVVDVDNDGAWDLVLTHINQPVRLLRNECPRKQPWLGIRLIGLHSNRDAIGARITAMSPDSYRKSVFVYGGGSYLSSRDNRRILAFPEGTTTAELIIDWPSGYQQRLTVNGLDRYVDVIEASSDK